MTIPSDAIPDSAFEAGAIAPAALSPTRPFYWSVRRELWENRSLYIAPLAAAGVVLFGFLIGAMSLSHNTRAMEALGQGLPDPGLILPYDIGAFAVILTTFVVAAFYCLGALHNERRDRSILFWKSLPVSDLTTVIAKASIALVVLPVVEFVIILAMQLVMLLLSTATLLAHGLSPAALWTQVPLAQMSLVLLYGEVTTSLWYAPVWGWLLLVSAWARRAPFLWAVLPPLGLCLLERIAFDTNNFGDLLNYRLTGGFAAAFRNTPHNAIATAASPRMDLQSLDPAGFLTTPGLWVGLVFAAAALAAAVWLRRRREPI